MSYWFVQLFRYTTHYTARIDCDQDLFIYIHTYIYIYIYFLFLRVVIWETLRACYFHSTSLSLTWFLLFTKALRFKRWKLGSPMTFALMVSSLRLSVCFICDKRAWVIFIVHSADSGTFLKRVTFRTGFISSCFRSQMRNNYIGGLYQNGTNLIFFPLVNFGCGWTARAKLLL